MAAAIRDPDRAETDWIAALQARREDAEKKRQPVTRHIEHKVPEEQKVCPKCGGHDFTKLGEGKMTEEYELGLAMVERWLHVQEELRCGEATCAGSSALDADLLGTPEHLEMRQTQSKAAMDDFKAGSSLSRAATRREGDGRRNQLPDR